MLGIFFLKDVRPDLDIAVSQNSSSLKVLKL